MAEETLTPAEKPQDNLVTSKHCITIKGKEIHYTVTVGTMVVSQESRNDGIYEGEQPRFSPLIRLINRETLQLVR